MDVPVAGRIALPHPWRVSRRSRRRLGRVVVISLWLHLTLLLLLLVTVHYERPEEELPPPATVAMVFEGGKPEGPARAQAGDPRPGFAACTPADAPTGAADHSRAAGGSLAAQGCGTCPGPGTAIPIAAHARAPTASPSRDGRAASGAAAPAATGAVAFATAGSAARHSPRR